MPEFWLMVHLHKGMANITAFSPVTPWQAVALCTLVLRLAQCLRSIAEVAMINFIQYACFGRGEFASVQVQNQANPLLWVI